MQVLDFVQTQGYFVLLILMIIEGPIVTTAAAFASSFGYFNVLIILLLSILGDIMGDLIYFEIGRRAREPLVEKYAVKLRLDMKTVEGLEEGLRKHFLKSIALIKFTPFLSSVGLILTGALKIKRKRFITSCLLISIPRSIFFTFIGYYLGVATTPILKYYNLTGYLVLIILAVAVIFYFVYKWAFKKISPKFK